jgi:hypothetical protein
MVFRQCPDIQAADSRQDSGEKAAWTPHRDGTKPAALLHCSCGNGGSVGFSAPAGCRANLPKHKVIGFLAG